MNIILAILILLPIFFSILFFTTIIKENLIHKMSVCFSGFIGLLSLTLLFGKNAFFAFSFSPFTYFNVPILNNDLLNDIGINISFGLDNLSIIMIILTTFIFFIVTFSTGVGIKNRTNVGINSRINLFYSLIFFLESILIGLFSATDMFLFFLLWDLEIIPVYLLITLWGNYKSPKAALKYVIYTFVGSLFILAGIILLYFSNFSINGIQTSNFEYISLNSLNIPMQILISICFLTGFGVKLPIFPLHRWLSEAHTSSATPVSIILAAILLKMGLYGIIRFNIDILSVGFAYIAEIVGLLAVINIIMGAGLAYFQKDIKQIIAYSSISNMGIILLAVSTMTKTGYIASVYHSISHALVVSGLFLIVGIIKNQYKTNNINRLSGLFCSSHNIYWFVVILFFSSIGIPFSSGFIGEFLTIYSAFASKFLIFKLYSIFAVAIIMLSALYLLRLVHTVFYGVVNQKTKIALQISKTEKISLYIICSLILILGIFPILIINFLN